MPGGFKKKTKRVDVHNHGWNAGVGRKAKITAPGKKRKMITQQRGNLECVTPRRAAPRHVPLDARAACRPRAVAVWAAPCLSDRFARHPASAGT